MGSSIPRFSRPAAVLFTAFGMASALTLAACGSSGSSSTSTGAAGSSATSALLIDTILTVFKVPQKRYPLITNSPGAHGAPIHHLEICE